MKQQRNSGFSRRDLFKSTAAAGLAGSAGVASATQTAGADNPIRQENLQPGTRDWMLTKTDITNTEPYR